MLKYKYNKHEHDTQSRQFPKDILKSIREAEVKINKLMSNVYFSFHPYSFYLKLNNMETLPKLQANCSIFKIHCFWQKINTDCCLQNKIAKSLNLESVMGSHKRFAIKIHLNSLKFRWISLFWYIKSNQVFCYLQIYMKHSSSYQM